MAIEFARAAAISRGSGGNVCRTAAYNARTKIVDERSGSRFNFSARGGHLYHEIVLPEYVDAKFRNLSLLMNEVEKHNDRVNSQLAREIVLALPDNIEITLEDRIELIHRFIKEMGFVEDGLGVVFDIHAPDEENKNNHVHIIVLDQHRFEGDGSGFCALKARDLQPAFRFKKILTREDKLPGKVWAKVQNDYFKEKGFDFRVDAISTIPHEHIGPVRMRNILNRAAERNEIKTIGHIEKIQDVDGVLDHITRTQSVFTRADIERCVKKIDDIELKSQVIEKVFASPRLLVLHEKHLSGSKKSLSPLQAKSGYYTTVEVRSEEERLLRIAHKLKDMGNRCVNEALVASFSRFSGSDGGAGDLNDSLSDVQIAGLRHILLSSSGVRVFRGRAGTGKSRVLGFANYLSESAGVNVIGLAPTHKASLELRDNGFKTSDTLKGFLFKYRNGKVAVPACSLIVLDEAGMIDTSSYLELFKIARNNNCNVIIAGDEKQLTSVERGGMFELFDEKFGSFELSDIRRQDAIWGREMASFFADGNVRAGINLLRENKALKHDDNLKSSMQRLVDDFTSSKYELNQMLAISVRNKEVDSLNYAIREVLKAQGRLKGAEYSIKTTDSTASEKHQEAKYMKGERIVFGSTSKNFGAKNGDFATLVFVSQDKFIARMDGGGGNDGGTGDADSNGLEVSFNPKEMHNFKHGYASTIYKVQGASVKSVYVLHNWVGNLRSSYVAMTRYVEEMALYTNHKATGSVSDLINQLRRVDEKSASLTFLTESDIDKMLQAKITEEEYASLPIMQKVGGWLKQVAGDISTTIGDRFHRNYAYYQFEEKPIAHARVDEIIEETASALDSRSRYSELDTISEQRVSEKPVAERLSRLLFNVNEVKEILSSKDAINYMAYAKARSITESAHEFLEYNHDLYITTLASLSLKRGRNDVDGGSTADEGHGAIYDPKVTSEAQERFSIALQKFSYPASYLEHLKENLNALSSRGNMEEVYGTLVRDVFLVHMGQLESVGLESSSDHARVVLDALYNIITSYQAKSANKQDTDNLSSLDQGIIASKVHDQLCKADWWNSDAMRKIDLVKNLTIMKSMESAKISTNFDIHVQGVNDNLKSKKSIESNIASSAATTKHANNYTALREENNEQLGASASRSVELIAISLLGSPNKSLSSWKMLRFGKTGKMAVCITGSKAGIWYDFSEDRGGDLFDLAAKENGGSFKEAKEYIKGVIGYDDSNISYIRSHASEKLCQKVSSQDAKEKEADMRKVKMASALYDKARDLDPESIAVEYLVEHRKIDKTLDFSRDLKTDEAWNKETRSYLPALIAFARNIDGRVTGGQRIYLDVETANKADVKVNKRSFGKISGSFVLVQGETQEKAKGHNGHITIIAEGVETALSVKSASISNEVKILSSLGVSNMKNYIPTRGEKILLCADNDGAGSSSFKVVNEAREKLEDRGAIVDIVMPKTIGADFNDVLQKEGPKVVQTQINIALEKLEKDNGLDRVISKIVTICNDVLALSQSSLVDHLVELRNIAPESLQEILDICKLEGSEKGLASVDRILKNSKALKEQEFGSFLNYHRKTLNDISTLNKKIDIKSLIEHLERLGKGLTSKDALREQSSHIDSVLVKSFQGKVFPELKLISKGFTKAKSSIDVIQIMHQEKALYADIYKNYWNLWRSAFTEAEHDKFMSNIVFHKYNPKYLENLERDIITLSKLDIWPEDKITETLRSEEDFVRLGQKIFKGCQDHIEHEVRRDLHYIETNKSLERDQLRFEDHKSYLEHRMADKDYGHYLVDTRPHGMLKQIYKLEHQAKQEQQQAQEKELEMHKRMDKDHGMSM